jgi:hypothetical protein
MILIVPHADITLVEVAQVKREARPDWRDALEEPLALWDGPRLAEVLRLIEQLPESEPMRCFSPGFGMRIHDKSDARAEVLFCFHCHIALMIDLHNPQNRHTGATFDPDSEPARELLARFRSGDAAQAASVDS